jgi:hypothetical protein
MCKNREERRFLLHNSGSLRCLKNTDALLVARQKVDVTGNAEENQAYMIKCSKQNKNKRTT